METGLTTHRRSRCFVLGSWGGFSNISNPNAPTALGLGTIVYPRSRPLMESFKQWLERKLGQAVTEIPYDESDSLRVGAMDALMRFGDDGRIEIDNNAAERSLRAVVFGKEELSFCRIGCRG